jgi:hypothetical protein
VKTQIGMKTTISLPSGTRWPFIVISDETAEKKVIVNRTTNAPVEITITRVDGISLRTTREGVEYLALTSEVVQYGYRPVMEPRFSTVVGLDATPEGEKISLQMLVEAHGASYSKWQEANYAARNTVVAADDL